VVVAPTDSNPCAHIAARFCQHIEDLRHVELTSIATGSKSTPRFRAGLMKPRPGRADSRHPEPAARVLSWRPAPLPPSG